MKTHLLVTLTTLSSALSTPAWALSQAEVDALVKNVDDRTRNVGDYKALCYMEQKDKGKNDLIFEGVVYRRQEDEKFLMMLLRPKSDAGKGWLRIDRNLFLYDPAVGKWERRTERERLANTETRRQDLDASHLARDFSASYLGLEKLGKIDAHKVELKVKNGADTPYPQVRIWANKDTGNLMKQQDFAESGKLMRTIYYPSWGKIFDKAKNSEVWYPEEIRIFDEVEQGNSSIVKIQKVTLEALDSNIFTKAWIESQSR